MQDYEYSAIGILAALIQLIINGSIMFRRNGSGKAYKPYRYLMISLFAYYITDAFWGIFAGMNVIPVLFADTTIYYVAMSAIIVSWSFYIVSYLDRTDFFALFFRRVGLVFFAFEIASLIVNFFYPCFFWFDANDAYQAGFIRYLALYIQDGLFLLAVILTGVIAAQSKGQMRIRCFAIFGFSSVMLIAIFFRLPIRCFRFMPPVVLSAAACCISSSWKTSGKATANVTRNSYGPSQRTMTALPLSVLQTTKMPTR